jgi:hypothetical protein
VPPFVQLGDVTIYLLGVFGTQKNIVSWGFESSPAHTGELGMNIDSLPTILISGRDEDRLELEECIEKLKRQAQQAKNGSLHRNGAVKIDHLVIFSSNFKRTIGMMAMCSIHPKRMTEVRGTKMCFFKSGDVVIELVDVGGGMSGSDPSATSKSRQDKAPSTSASSSRPSQLQQPQQQPSTISQIDRPQQGAQFWGLTLLTQDLDATAHYLGPLARKTRPAVQGKGRRIFTLAKGKAGISVNMAFIDAVKKEDEAASKL